MSKNAAILILSDQHFPYAHPDIIAFLKAVKGRYKPDLVVNIGDEADGHAISFHPSDPDLFSPGDELLSAIEKMQPLYKLFPVMKLVESNHGSLVYRKGKFHGLPREVFKSYREILRAPQGWTWDYDLTIKMSNGQYCYFHHGKTAAPGALSKNMGMCAVQGHHHGKFQINYWANPVGLYWDMHVGCLIDHKSLAFAYGSNSLPKPIIGVGVILEGHPRLVPMVLDRHGRWIGRLV